MLFFLPYSTKIKAQAINNVFAVVDGRLRRIRAVKSSMDGARYAIDTPFTVIFTYS